MSRTASLPKIDREADAEALHPAFVRPRWVLILMAVIFYAAAIPAAWNVINHSYASTKAIEHVLITYNMKNEGSLTVDRYAKQHPLLGFFMSSPVKHEMELPSHEEAAEALTTGVHHDLETVRHEAEIAAWWSWFLISFSVLYIISAIALDRRIATRAVIFALTSVSVFCFVVGILAPAMIIWTAPKIPMASGDLSFVLQHEVRGIAAIIWELLTKGHWIIGGFLLLFSIVTPMTKCILTFFTTGCRSRELNLKIGEFLHTIGKWSMADVFVAAVLLALYALKAQEATKSIPCLGLYYFIGYCLLSMTTTEILILAHVTDGPRRKSKTRLGLTLVAGLFVAFFCFASASGIYTYEQYTANEKEPVHAPSSPEKLNDANLVMPTHPKAP